MNIQRTLLLLLLSLFFVSCSTTITNVADAGMKDNEYDRDYFQIENNLKLESIINSIMMLNTMVYYESYGFDRSSGITNESLNNGNIKQRAAFRNFSTETSSGTATIIYSEKGRILLLTCAHVLNFPDTLITYYKDNYGMNSGFIESISIKTRQTVLLPELSVSNKLEILAVDPESDIALVGKEISALSSKKLVPINIPFGSSNELSWGTKVFIVGYPLNNKMITSGIVSPSLLKEKEYFFVDAVFNRGFSGGVVLAIRDGAPNFEFVGMVKSGTVHRSFNIIPDTDDPDFTFHPSLPYKGDLMIEEKSEIKYGVTKIMSVEKIIGFLKNNKANLQKLGYSINYSF